MFSKQAKSGHAGQASDLTVVSDHAPARKSSHKVASLIADDISIAGDLRGEGELQVDGMIRGDVTVTRLAVGESGQIEGSVTADVADIRGRVVGSITAKQVRLFASAHVDGDITHEQLTMEAGAFFEGRSLRFQRANIPLAASGDVIDISAASGGA
jgi:cytoskeletal protein CcmA (bactofilin family)